MAEANKKGIRATSRTHHVAFSTLRVWTKQDFGDMPGSKKRLPGGGRPLRWVKRIKNCQREHKIDT